MVLSSCFGIPFVLKKKYIWKVVNGVFYEIENDPVGDW